jgi:hypothetical protein
MPREPVDYARERWDASRRNTDWPDFDRLDDYLRGKLVGYATRELEEAS